MNFKQNCNEEGVKEDSIETLWLERNQITVTNSASSVFKAACISASGPHRPIMVNLSVFDLKALSTGLLEGP